MPIARINLFGSPTAVMIASLIAGFWITGWAGKARGIDPGRPGVPEFGRKLYRLRFTSRKRPVLQKKLAAADAVAIARKCGFTVDRLGDCKTLDTWVKALNVYRNQLARAVFGAIVLDYDGTIVDTRDRRDPPDQEMTDVLVGLSKTTLIGIATGRESVGSLRTSNLLARNDLATCLCRILQWRRDSEAGRK